MNKANLWAIQVSKLAKMKVKLQHRSLFNTTDIYTTPQSCAATVHMHTVIHMQAGQISIRPQIAHTDHQYTLESSQQKQTTEFQPILFAKVDRVNVALCCC